MTHQRADSSVKREVAYSKSKLVKEDVIVLVWSTAVRGTSR